MDPKIEAYAHEAVTKRLPRRGQTRRALLVSPFVAPLFVPMRAAGSPAIEADGKFTGVLGRDPRPPRPIGRYVPARRSGNLVYLSATPAKDENGITFPGVLGRDLSLEAGRHSARRAALTLLEYLWFELDETFAPVTQILSLTGYVASAEGFWNQAAVMDGASEVLVELFGPRIGLPTRTSIGVRHMPLNASVAVSAIVEVG